MGRSSKPRKPYRPKVSNAATRLRTQPWILDTSFGPIEEILEHIVQGGELLEVENGALIYVSPRSGKAREVPSLCKAQAEIFTVVRGRDPACPDAEPLRRVALALRQGEVSEDAVQAALVCLAQLRAYAANQPASAIADAAQSVALRAQLDASDLQAGMQRIDGEGASGQRLIEQALPDNDGFQGSRTADDPVNALSLMLRQAAGRISPELGVLFRNLQRAGRLLHLPYRILRAAFVRPVSFSAAGSGMHVSQVGHFLLRGKLTRSEGSDLYAYLSLETAAPCAR